MEVLYIIFTDTTEEMEVLDIVANAKQIGSRGVTQGWTRRRNLGSRIQTKKTRVNKHLCFQFFFMNPTPILFDPQSLPLAVLPTPPTPQTPPAFAPFIPWTMALGAFLLAGLMAGVTALGPLLRPKG